MPASMTIGDFSRATRLSAKALRFYHRVGLLEPATVDPATSYRRYDPTQIEEARMIHQLRALDMPIDDIRRTLEAQELTSRRAALSDHLTRLEQRLAETRTAVASLRALLESPTTNPIEIHETPAQDVVIIRDTIPLRDLGDWFTATRLHLDEAVAAAGAERAGALGGLWSTELFLDEVGEGALFYPVGGGRAGSWSSPAGSNLAAFETLPAARLAVIVHEGGDETIGNAYAALGTYVAELGGGAPGPVRESYGGAAPAGPGSTEIGWPMSDIT